uniref:Female-specific orf protein n=1 Tax=Toxolasma paulum TaxID=1009866 RepID=F4ZFP6_9BIVA
MLNALGYQLTLVIKLKHLTTNLCQSKKMQKLIAVTVSILMIILLNTFYSTPESVLPNPLLTDNPLEQNQPTSASPTPTCFHPLKDSPASTNISDKA